MGELQCPRFKNIRLMCVSLVQATTDICELIMHFLKHVLNVISVFNRVFLHLAVMAVTCTFLTITGDCGL